MKCRWIVTNLFKQIWRALRALRLVVDVGMLLTCEETLQVHLGWLRHCKERADKIARHSYPGDIWWVRPHCWSSCGKRLRRNSEARSTTTFCHRDRVRLTLSMYPAVYWVQEEPFHQIATVPQEQQCAHTPRATSETDDISVPPVQAQD